MAPHFTELLLLAAAWLLFGILHSLLASNRCKAWVRSRWPEQMHGYRIGFNLIAIITLLPILVLERSFDAIPIWSWQGIAKMVSLSLIIAAIAGFIWSTRFYDMSHFAGTRQWRYREATDDDCTFTISPLHRVVRHPWYSLALVILWMRDIESTTLVTNIMLSGYFIVGAKLEENKLRTAFGERYRTYQQQVPAILPRPWRYLREKDMKKLVTSNHR